MKTPIIKRAIAFILAALILMGTLGYLFSTIAYGLGDADAEGEPPAANEVTPPAEDNTLGDSAVNTAKDNGVEALNDNNNNNNNNNNVSTLSSDMSYTIQKIYRNSNGGSVTFDIEKSSLNDPTIERNYYVDVVVQFSIPDIQKTDVIVNSKPKIKILVDRGSFLFRNATKSAITVMEQSTRNVDGGVICYVLLKGLQYTGDGNTLAFTVQSKTDSNGDLISPYIYEQFSTEVSSCEPYVPKETTPEPDDDPKPSPMEVATPYVIINNYDYGGIITAGETFPLSVTLYNTSKNIDVQNMMVTITMPEAFMLTSSSNTFYIEELHNEESVTKSVDVTAKANADPQSHNIEISMKYQYVDEKLNVRKDNTTQETISIPVVQVDRFQLTGVDVPMEVYVGEESYLSVNFVNKGRSEVYNLSAEISGDIQNPGQQQNLGNLASGATGSADFYITPNGEGVCSGEVLITYEDTNMEEKTATIQWSTNVVDPFGGMDFGGGFGDYDMGMMEDPDLMGGEQKSSLPFIAGGVGVAAVVAAVIIRKRIKRKKREAEDADL